MIDQYKDVLLPYADAKAASVLCPGRPIKYTIRDKILVTDAWLGMHVSRNMLKNDELDVYAFCVILLLCIYFNVHTCTDIFYCFPFSTGNYLVF